MGFVPAKFETATLKVVATACSSIRAGSVWDVARINVTDITNGTPMVSFVVPGGAMEIGGPAVKLERLRDVMYQVAVTTSDIRGADTDGLLCVRLIGDKSASDDVTVSKEGMFGSDLKRGATDVFEFQACDVGKLQSMVVSVLPVFPTGSAPNRCEDWRVTHRWLGKPGITEPRGACLPFIPSTLTLCTLTPVPGMLQQLNIKPPHNSLAMQPCITSCITLLISPPCFGRLLACSDWHLAQVTVTDTSTGVKALLIHNDWVKAGKGNEVYLRPSSSEQVGWEHAVQLLCACSHHTCCQ